MKRAFILILLLVTPVFGSEYSSESSFVGSGALITNYEHQWGSGNNLQNLSPNYIGGASSSGIVSLPGITGYDSRITLDATDGHKFVSGRQFEVSSGTVYFDSLAMEDSGEPEPELYCDAQGNILPPSEGTNNSTMVSLGQYPYYQSVVGDVYGFMENGRYKSDKAVVDADYALSTRAYWEGSGVMTDNFRAEAYAGADKNSTTMNYRNGVREHNTLVSNRTGGWQVSQDHIWKDFSNPFIQADEEANTSEEDSND